MRDLFVRLVRHGDGLALLLCDAEGKVFPGQRKVVVNSAINDVVTVTVEFVVSEHVRLVGDMMPTPPPPPKDW